MSTIDIFVCFKAVWVTTTRFNITLTIEIGFGSSLNCDSFTTFEKTWSVPDLGVSEFPFFSSSSKLSRLSSRNDSVVTSDRSFGVWQSWGSIQSICGLIFVCFNYIFFLSVRVSVQFVQICSSKSWYFQVSEILSQVGLSKEDRESQRFSSLK